VELFEFEVATSTQDALKSGVLALDIRKILVAEADWWEAYQTAVAMSWRGDRQVTSCQWVP
jgi:hypothetical protein